MCDVKTTSECHFDVLFWIFRKKNVMLGSFIFLASVCMCVGVINAYAFQIKNTWKCVLFHQKCKSWKSENQKRNFHKRAGKVENKVVSLLPTTRKLLMRRSKRWYGGSHTSAPFVTALLYFSNLLRDNTFARKIANPNFLERKLSFCSKCYWMSRAVFPVFFAFSCLE